MISSKPGYVVPGLIVKSAREAVSWVSSCRGLYWAIPNLPALAPSTAPHMFDDYRLTAQAPAPGRMLYQGFFVGRGYHPTPLTLTVAASASDETSLLRRRPG